MSHSILLCVLLFFCRMINVRSGLNSLLADLMQIESDETESIRGRNRSLFWFFIVNTYYIYVSREWRKFAILIHRFSHAKRINVLLMILTVELDFYIYINQAISTANNIPTISHDRWTHITSSQLTFSKGRKTFAIISSANVEKFEDNSHRNGQVSHVSIDVKLTCEKKCA